MPDSTDRPRLIVFAKYPEPGRVKTRMVPPLTDEQAAKLHQACLEATLEQILPIEGVNVRLAVSPDDKVAALADAVGVGVGRCQPQGEGDLGDRLCRAMMRAFEEGASAVLFLGADSPTLPVEYVQNAIELLGHERSRAKPVDAAMGPCLDGGYYLLGVSRPIPGLFQKVDWGGKRVAEQTRVAARAAGITLKELPISYDVDRFEDLHHAAEDLAYLFPIDRMIRMSTFHPDGSDFGEGIERDLASPPDAIRFPKAMALSILISGLLRRDRE